MNFHMPFNLPFPYSYMVLIATSLRAAFVEPSRSFQYSLMLFLAALFALVGGYFMGGLAILSYDLSVGAVVAALLMILLFSYIFVWFASDLSSFLGHKTYLSREEFAIRGARVFVLWAIAYALTFFFFNYVSYPFDAVLSFIVSLFAIYATVIIAIDGYSIVSSVSASLSLLRDQWLHVLEFIVLSLLLVIPVFLIDAVGGFFGSVLAIILMTFLAIPWLTTHVVLTYLYRYPIVVAALRKLERL